MDWAKAPQKRDQMVLFPTRLEDAVGAEHHARFFDDILSQLDWSKWEATYDRKRGQPPIHSKIVASVILYGLLTRIRSSRSLEESLQVRLDFRWLVEGRSIDHTTLSEFRRKNADALSAAKDGCVAGSVLGQRAARSHRGQQSRSRDRVSSMMHHGDDIGHESVSKCNYTRVTRLTRHFPFTLSPDPIQAQRKWGNVGDRYFPQFWGVAFDRNASRNV